MLALGALLHALCVSAAAAAPEVLELRHLRLIDGSGAPAREVERLLVHEGIIARIDAHGAEPPDAPGTRWTRIDLDGATVMPGLIDTHVHIARFSDTHARAEAILQQALRGGITAVRDLGGDARALAEIERTAVSGERVLPGIVFSAVLGGPELFVQGPASRMAPGRVAGEASWARRIDADMDAVRIVAEARGSGSRNLKLYGNLDLAQVRALAAEARRQQMMTTAHATVFPVRPGELVDAGVDSLAHAAYLVWEAVDTVPADYGQRIAGPWTTIAPDHPRLLALYRRMAERGTTLDATLYVYREMQNYPGVPKMEWTTQAADWGERATRAARAAGVRVTAGTDWFEPRDDSDLPHTHAELALLVDAAGFTPMQAIEAGTRNGAIALGLGDSHGTLEVGKVADLLVLDADPLADIRNTTRIRFVLRRGQVVERD